MCKGLETLSIGDGVCTGLNCGKSHSHANSGDYILKTTYNISNAVSGVYSNSVSGTYSNSTPSYGI